MRRKIQLITCALLLSGIAFTAEPRSFDVVVYGGTAGGVMAAVAAAQHGLRVALLEPGRHVGGMVSGGLSSSDVESQQQLVGGLTHQFFARLGRHYGEASAYKFEPHVAEQTFRDMLAEAHVQFFPNARVADVAKEGAQIQVLRTQGAGGFHGKIFIDCGYEGDLMKAAGVAYTVGREGQQKYGEWLAGRQDLLPGPHQFAFPVSAERMEGGSANALLQYVMPQEKVVPTGEGDGHFQSYCFRLCLTDDPGNRLAVEKPDGYDPARYELARLYLESGKGALSLRDFLGIVRIPNGKADVNSTGPVSTNLLGASWEYPEASYERRKQIWDEHLTWAQGLIYFCRTTDRFPRRSAPRRAAGVCRKTSFRIPGIGPISFTFGRHVACWANTFSRNTICRSLVKSTMPSEWPATTSISARCSGWRIGFTTFLQCSTRCSPKAI